MIIRVTRSRVARGHEGEVLDIVRGLTEELGAVPGLHAAVFGRSLDGDAMSLIAITTWESFEAIRAVYGDAWPTRSILPGGEHLIANTSVEHYEDTLSDVTASVEERRPER